MEALKIILGFLVFPQPLKGPALPVKDFLLPERGWV
jgi:hypothetical protein